MWQQYLNKYMKTLRVQALYTDVNKELLKPFPLISTKCANLTLACHYIHGDN